jgi:polysaccharide biosynthesis transport protein
MSSSIAQPADGFGLAWMDQLRRLAATWQVRVVLACGLGSALLAVTWAFISPGRWSASQSLVVRDDLLGESFKPGRFNSPESLKSAQETILHIARKPQVIRDALLAAGISPDALDAQTIEDWQQLVSVVAPNGNEFGKTEVFVLGVRGRSLEQATKVVNALTTQTENHLRQYRSRMLESMESELAASLEQASQQYAELAERVGEIERSVGAELPALRAMIESSSMGSDLQHALEQIRSEIRTSTAELERAERQRDLLSLAASDEAGDFVSTSSDLIELQPVLKRLVDGLVDARLVLSAAMGRYDEGHPSISNARSSVNQTSAALRSELLATAAGLEMQIAMYGQKLARLSRSEAEYSERLIGLGKLRVEYKSLIDEMTRRSESLTKGRTDLAEIQSLASASNNVSLITRVGDPQLATRADGLSKRALALAGLITGLLGGLGIVLLNPGPLSSPARWREWLASAGPVGRPAEPKSSQSPAVLAGVPASPAATASPATGEGYAPKPRVRPATALKEMEPEAGAIPRYGSGRTANPDPAKPSMAGPSPSFPVGKQPSPSPAPSSAVPEVIFTAVAPATTTSATAIDSGNLAASPMTEKPGAQVPGKVAEKQSPQAVVETVPTQAASTETAPVNVRPASEQSPPNATNSGAVAGSQPPPAPVSTVKPGLIIESSGDGRPGEAGRSALRDALAASRAELPSRIAPTQQLNTSVPPTGSGDSVKQASTSSSVEPVRSAAPTASTFNQSTISLEELRIEEIRRQILELEPGFTLDAFCEPVRKESVRKEPDQPAPPT